MSAQSHPGRIATIVAALVCTPSGVWGDDKTTPASFCVHSYPLESHGIYVDRPTLSENGAVSNPDADDDNYVRCPIIRDNETSALAAIEVYVYDGTSAGYVECRLYHTYATGATWGSNDTSVNGYDVLTPSVPATHWAFGQYTVQCNLPEDDGTPSRIEGYWWQE